MPGPNPGACSPGSAGKAVKGRVILAHGSRWEMWACIHLLDDPQAADRTWTEYAVSADGLEWRWEGVALRPGSRAWDARGTRVTAVWRQGSGCMALYDGRATAEENFEERTGLDTGSSALALTPSGDAPVATSAPGPGGLRYACVVPLPFGGHRLHYEATREDGAHDLRTELVPAGCPATQTIWDSGPSRDCADPAPRSG